MAKAKPTQEYQEEVNDQCVPSDMGLTQTKKVKTVDADVVGDAFFHFPAAQHLQEADPDLGMAIWSWGDQGRVLQQESRNGQENKKKR